MQSVNPHKNVSSVDSIHSSTPRSFRMTSTSLCPRKFFILLHQTTCSFLNMNSPPTHSKFPPLSRKDLSSCITCSICPLSHWYSFMPFMYSARGPDRMVQLIPKDLYSRRVGSAYMGKGVPVMRRYDGMRSGEPRPIMVIEVGTGSVKYVCNVILLERARKYA